MRYRFDSDAPLIRHSSARRGCRFGFTTSTVQSSHIRNLSELRQCGVEHIEVRSDYLCPRDVLAEYPHASYIMDEHDPHIARLIARMGFSRIIVNPNRIADPTDWRFLGSALLVENQDASARNKSNLENLMTRLPEAGICLNFTSALYDPAIIAEFILKYGRRIREVRMGSCAPDMGSNYIAMSEQTARVAVGFIRLLPRKCPVVIDVPLDAEWHSAKKDLSMVVDEYRKRQSSKPAHTNKLMVAVSQMAFEWKTVTQNMFDGLTSVICD